MNEVLSITGLIGSVVKDAEKEFGRHINYMWGDWTYIANQLSIWDKTPSTKQQKYPVVCLFVPINEQKTKPRYYCTANVDLLIAAPTSSGLTNEEREKKSFEAVLRPLYASFMRSLVNCKSFDFQSNHAPHTYAENYGYGSHGIMMSQGKRFGDLIDGIDIKNLVINVKKINCNGYTRI